VDTLTDSANCGVCGKSCNGKRVCVAGVCVKQ
jgi:hypothetical protein